MKGMLYFITSLISICTAHVIRIIRWKLFIGIYEKPDERKLFQSLSAGYLANYFVPLKLGDVLRAWLSGYKMKSGKVLGFSTVIVDRYLDIVAVGIIFVFLSLGKIGGNDIRQTAYFYVILMLVFLCLAVVIYTFRGTVKKIVKAVAGIFNDGIEAAILSFAWALIWNFKDIFQKINKAKLVCTTAGMWFFYLVSYFLFAEYLSLYGTGTTWMDMFFMLFTQNSVKKSTFIATLSEAVHPIPMIIYMILPLLVLFVISLFFKEETDEKTENIGYLNLLPHQDSGERLGFLENYFSNKNKAYIENYLKINQEISIIRDYSAGSNATTMLCIDAETTFFRKYAFGSDGEKLYEQISWLKKTRTQLPCLKFLRKKKLICTVIMICLTAAIP